jgi:uncharacterized membrane protein
MIREPGEYTINGRIERVGAHEFVALVIVTPTDNLAPGASFTEQGKARTREAAVECLWKMVREVSARLRRQGNTVVNVETDL